MSLKGLRQFQHFDLDEFLCGKRLLFVKAEPWKDGEAEAGSKVIVQIIEDKTRYANPDTDNFGEQLVVKVKGTAPSAFAQLRPLNSEVIIQDKERASLYGEYGNQLSITAKIAVKNTQPAK